MAGLFKMTPLIRSEGLIKGKMIIRKGLVKQFKTLVNLIVTKVGNGTINPDVGTYPTEPGTDVEFTFTPDIDSYFEKAVVNDVDTTDNPLIVTVNDETRVEGRFLEWVEIMEIFSTAPTLVGSNWVFEGGLYDSIVKNMQVAKFGTTDYINSNLYLTGGVFRIEFYYYTDVALSNKYILVSKTGVASSKGLIIQMNSANDLSILTSDGTTNTTYNPAKLLVSSLNHVIIEGDGITGHTVTVTINGTVYTTTTLNGWAGNSALMATIGYSVQSVNGYMSCFDIQNKLKYIFNHGQGAVVYNLLGGTNGTITGAVLATFWGTKSDLTIPYAYVLGCTLYDNNSDTTLMPICFDTSQVISGFTKDAYYPPNSGILRGLSNTYNIPVNVDLQNAGLASGNQNYAYFDGLTETATLKITKYTNAIYKILARKTQ